MRVTTSLTRARRRGEHVAPPAGADGWRDLVVGTVAGVGVLGIVLLGALWFFSDSRAAERAFDDAVARWESVEPASYSFDYRYCDGMCGSCERRVTVTDGEVSEVSVLEGDCPADADSAPTMEDLFALLERVRSSPTTDSFSTEYDPTWGFPESFESTCPDNTPDCGTGLEVTDFEVES